MDLNTLSPTLIPSNAEEDGFDHHHVKQQYLEDRETFEGENLLTWRMMLSLAGSVVSSYKGKKIH